MRQNRTRSVRVVVIAAACVVAAMTLVAGAISWHGYQRIEDLLVSMVDDQAGTLAQALKLAEISNRYAAGGGEIEAARNQVQRQNAAVSLAQHAFALHEAIAALRRLPETTQRIPAIERLVGSLDDALHQQNRLAERRLDLEGRARRTRVELARLKADAGALLARLDSDSTAAPGLETAALYALLLLSDAGQIETTAQLRAAQADLAAARDRYARAVAALPEGSPQRAAAGRLLAGIDALANPEDGVHATRESLLSVRTDIDRTGAEVREVVSRLGSAVSRLVTAVETENEHAKEAVRAQIEAGETWLLLVALATFLGPLSIVWLAVSRTIVGPLSGLAAATRRIAEGDLYAPIPPARHREFREIADALTVFRDNTVALAERTEALARSEGAHRAARQEAERTLADLRIAQEQLIQSEKLAALASVVSGVAHEVNTPLGITLTSASLLIEELSAMAAALRAGQLRRSEFEQFLARATEIATLMQSNMERAANLVQAFKQVSADQSSEHRRVFELRDVIEQTVVSVRPACDRAGHAVHFTCPEGIMMDTHPGALSQVLTILIMNSLDHAFEIGQHGTITIAATPAGDGAVRVNYRDDGRGIPEPMRRRVFEPFFTTRRAQGNTGLGLHIAFNIAHQSLKGRLDLMADTRHGAHFALVLPLALPVDEAEADGADTLLS
ncbi:ATP-binding protein [Azospirillum sp. TSO22-1]|uniref:ATP-binding protein n=1 Tax=Azospirillum sp. TSO22-1 TaxID=716789 RepID=UPI000D65C444|nr:ATP-binding protein [Azospirillum sp. TSO22-1]